MKKSYLALLRTSCLALVLLSFGAASAQTTLTKGDIAFTGYISNAAVTDEFSFVLLANISSGTTINFTDDAWLRTSSTTGSWRGAEETITWTSNAAYSAGTEIYVVGLSATLANSGTSAGTVTGTALNLSTSGDQIIAYQGTVGTATPNFISAIHMNVYVMAQGDPVNTTAADWDGTANTSVGSGLPSDASGGLTTGVDCIWIGTTLVPSSEHDNGRFVCANLATNTIAGIRAACNNQAFWLTSDFPNPIGFTLPTSCNYLNILAVKLISFQAKNNLGNVETKWEVANQKNVKQYEVERSFDGTMFDKIGTVPVQPNSLTTSYSFIDVESLKTKADVIYYRLRTLDLDGKFSYSEIVTVRNDRSAGLEIVNLANPVRNILGFTLLSRSSGKAELSVVDMAGRVMATRDLQLKSGSSFIEVPEMNRLPNGMYMLKVNMNGNKVINRFVKQ